MKYMMLLTGLFLFNAAAKADTGTQPIPTTFAAVASFNSICCGPPSDSFIRAFVSKFNKSKKAKVKVYQKGGCGREGEFKLFFSLSALKKSTSTQFLKALNNLIVQENARITAAQKSLGSIELQMNVDASTITNCRMPMVAWK